MLADTLHTTETHKHVLAALIVSWTYSAVALRASHVRVPARGPFPILSPFSPTLLPVLCTLSYQIKGTTATPSLDMLSHYIPNQLLVVIWDLWLVLEILSDQYPNLNTWIINWLVSSLLLVGHFSFPATCFTFSNKKPLLKLGVTQDLLLEKHWISPKFKALLNEE